MTLLHYKLTGRHPVPISVKTKGLPLTKNLHRLIRGSIAVAIGRSKRQVRGVFVWIEDASGPGGGRDIRCRMFVYLRSGNRVSTSAKTTDEFTAVGLASYRVRMLLDHKLRKPLSTRRLAPRRIHFETNASTATFANPS